MGVETVIAARVWTPVCAGADSAEKALEPLRQPSQWKRGCRVVVDTESDLFHESVPNDYIAAVFGIMAATPRHLYQIATAHPDRALRWFRWRDAQVRERDLQWESWRVCEEEASERVDGLPAIDCQSPWPLDNVWLGVRVETQDDADARIPLLLQVPAALRFVSCEPLLGPVDLTRVCDKSRARALWINSIEARAANPADASLVATYGSNYPYARIDWVVAGGEAGRDARPMHPDWPRALRDQCNAAGVPFCFTQWGEWIGGRFDCRKGKMVCDATDGGRAGRIFWTNPGEPKVHLFDAADHYWTNAAARVGKKNAGRLLDGVEHSTYPQGG